MIYITRFTYIYHIHILRLNLTNSLYFYHKLHYVIWYNILKNIDSLLRCCNLLLIAIYLCKKILIWIFYLCLKNIFLSSTYFVLKYLYLLLHFLSSLFRVCLSTFLLVRSSYIYIIYFYTSKKKICLLSNVLLIL